MISDAQLESLGRYALYALIGAAIVAGLKLGTELPGDAPIAWREIASVFLLSLCGTLSTAFATTTLARPGDAPVIRQVETLRSQGTHRADMVVLPRDQAVAAIAANGSVEAAFTPTQEKQITDALERRMKAEPANPDDEHAAERRA